MKLLCSLLLAAGACADLAPFLQESATRTTDHFVGEFALQLSPNTPTQRLHDIARALEDELGVSVAVISMAPDDAEPEKKYRALSVSGAHMHWQLDSLRRVDEALLLEPTFAVTAQKVQQCGPSDECSWGLDRICRRNLPLQEEFEYSETADTETVYVIDSGVNPRHPSFQGRVLKGACFNRQGDLDMSMEGCQTDCYGHGTHVAGTIGSYDYGVAKKVAIKSVQTLSCEGLGSTTGSVAGLTWAVNDHLLRRQQGKAGRFGIVNMSLGAKRSVAFNNAVRSAVANDVVVVAASGNMGADACNYSPGSAPEALTVGATSKQDHELYFSNAGVCVDVLAPGERIRSLDNVPVFGTPSGAFDLDGTSMAAPHAAGAVAVLLASEGHDAFDSVDDIVNEIVAQSTQGVATTRHPDTPNRLLYVAP